MKKFLAAILVLVLMFSFVGCKKGTDVEEIQKANKIVVGITDYFPVNYKENGEWTGFDSEFARLFAKELGVEIEFVEIKWSEKYKMLDDRKIDCIWNAMTIIPEEQVYYSVSEPYMHNGQVLVMKADVVNNYENGYDVRNLRFGAEKNSAGASCIGREGYEKVKHYTTQYGALEAVSSGEVDAIIIDTVMADVMVGKGNKYTDLAKGFDYSPEVCGVAFRKDSDLTPKFNKFLEKIRDKELKELAEKYGMELY